METHDHARIHIDREREPRSTERLSSPLVHENDVTRGVIDLDDCEWIVGPRKLASQRFVAPSSQISAPSATEREILRDSVDARANRVVVWRRGPGLSAHLLHVLDHFLLGRTPLVEVAVPDARINDRFLFCCQQSEALRAAPLSGNQRGQLLAGFVSVDPSVERGDANIVLLGRSSDCCSASCAELQQGADDGESPASLRPRLVRVVLKRRRTGRRCSILGHRSGGEGVDLQDLRRIRFDVCGEYRVDRHLLLDSVAPPL